MIIGIDLSLRGTGLVALPRDFATSLDWARVSFRTVGHPLPKHARECDRIGRLVRLSMEVTSFAVEHGATHAVFEDYAYSRQATASRAIAELGGVAKTMLAFRHGLDVSTVPASAARKLLLGHVPRKGQKDAVQAMLERMSAPFETGDECDAFTVANWLLAELGEVAVSMTEAA